MAPTMPLDDIKPGMQGTAYTVVDNSGIIKPFYVSIIGTIDNGKGATPYILARANGDLIEQTKGVLQGMSGSPVYINGKLIGALSAGFKENDPNVFLITPIDNMLNIWNYKEVIAPETESETETKNESKTETESEDEIDDETENKSEEIIETESETEDKANFIYNGFNLDSLKEIGFKDLSIGATTAPKINYESDIQGGSAVAVAAVIGDFTVGATGTVTLVDEEKLLAFGHGFTSAGNVNFFLAEASVIGSVTGNNGMKVASVGPVIGTVNQDRNVGIGGIIGKFPATVPVNVDVNGDKYSAIMAYNENLTAGLGAAIAYSALNKSTDSSANGTVKVEFDIKTDIVEGGTLSRENTYYSDSDVGKLAVGELLQALNIVSTNTTTESNIYGIDVRMKYETLRKTASLISAKADKVVKPGQEVVLNVKLQPYRAEAIDLKIPYTVPVTAAPGAFVVDIHGGGLVPVLQVQNANVIMPSTKSPSEAYTEKIQQLLNANKNNELIIKPSTVVKTEKQLKAEIKRLAKLSKRGIKPVALKPTKFATDYVVDNVIQCTINVEKN